MRSTCQASQRPCAPALRQLTRRASQGGARWQGSAEPFCPGALASARSAPSSLSPSAHFFPHLEAPTFPRPPQGRVCLES